MLVRFALRDSALLAFAWGLWWLLAERSAGSGFVADFSGWVVGLMLFVGASVFHEWGHFLGAVLTRSRVKIRHKLTSAFVFSFPAEGNNLGQFVAMSLGGFLATAASILVFYTLLPDAYLATRVARGGAIFLAFLGVTLEVPLLVYGLVKRGVPTQAAV